MKQIEPTQIKIYTKVTRKETKHQLLCGNSMKLDTVNNLNGR